MVNVNRILNHYIKVKGNKSGLSREKWMMLATHWKLSIEQIKNIVETNKPGYLAVTAKEVPVLGSQHKLLARFLKKLGFEEIKPVTTWFDSRPEYGKEFKHPDYERVIEVYQTKFVFNHSIALKIRSKNEVITFLDENGFHPLVRKSKIANILS